MKLPSVDRLIRIYPKDDVHPVGVIYLSDFDLGELKKLFKTEKDDPMFDCFEISTEEAPYFKTRYNIDLDLSTYEYFLEAEDNED